jgi:hypothetical protein
MTSTTNDKLALASAVSRSVQGERAYLDLWFALARRPWMSLVLVPGHPGISADESARMLAEVGQKVSGNPVRAITMSSLDYGTALALADLQDQVRRLADEFSQGPRANEVRAIEVPAVGSDPESAPGNHSSGVSLVAPMPSRFVIAIPSLIAEPLGLAATQSADAVVLLVELGKSRMADVRRMVEQVGRERIVGCFLVK